MQTRALLKGQKAFNNGTAHLVAQYNQRRRLKEIGITQRLEDLDAYHAEAFLIISEEISAHEDAERKKSEAKMKSRRG